MSTEIQLTFDPEKLEALSYYLAKAHTTPMKELTAALNDLYEKHVPADTREYLERKQPPARPRPRPKKPAPQVPLRKEVPEHGEPGNNSVDR